ncbi:c-type cytochrome [Tuwongella immobilis]|uniref:c-type cytochrome n=1 Tax=Tuwongella immobilis TaxID=692036 RepID=UPI0018D85054|nr:c-type cytochrome [Tuwongella immobilis]
MFTAQFAIGGGMLMMYFQWLAMTGRSSEARTFLDRYFKFLVLLSFVTGALTGVGMWFTSIQISPRTIGLMIDEFHWLWGVEWTFFCLEVVAGYCFYRYGAELSDRARIALLGLYTVGAWASLFWINGILSWQLTPGEWTSGHVWKGFFNPTFWPSLFYRTVACLTTASLVSMVVINSFSDFDRDQRTRLINRAAMLLAPMATMPLLGLWFVGSLPEDSREWVLGGSIAMTLFLNLAVIASVLIAGYALVGLIRQRLYINGATATLLCVLAFGATAGGEFVREGVRKPFTVRENLYSNAIKPSEIAHLRAVGGTSLDPFPLRDADAYPNDQVRTGALVFRQQCSICHTPAGVNSLTGLTASWDTDQKRLNIAKLQRLKPFMPPFAGPPHEVEALVQWIEWQQSNKPAQWNDSRTEPENIARLASIQRWLDEAGTAPAKPHDRVSPKLAQQLSQSEAR